MIRPNKSLGYREPKEAKWAYLFFGLLLIFAFGYVCYKAYIQYTSEVRYTVFNFYEKYSDSKNVGMKVYYLVDGERKYSVCYDMGCKKIKKNSRKLGYYYVADPSFFGVFYDLDVPDTVIDPPNGWQTIPEF
jgi:hypothetical protein